MAQRLHHGFDQGANRFRISDHAAKHNTVPLRALDYGTWALPVAMLLMRPLGFLVAVHAGMALGLHLPGRIGWRELLVISVVLTIGFTMALFFATSAMGAGPALSAIKIGALLSAGGAVLSFAAARILRVAPAGR